VADLIRAVERRTSYLALLLEYRRPWRIS